MSDVSSTRLYLGNLPRDVTREMIQEHFRTESGKITEIKLMNGFGFIQYEDALDAREIVPYGSDLDGKRLTVQFARGPRHKVAVNGPSDRSAAPRPRRTIYQMQITGLPPDTSWQDLKDFARQSGLDVVYSETGRDRDGKGFVEFESAKDLATAVEKLDSHEFKGATVHCVADIQEERPREAGYRSRTPPRRYGPPGLDDPYERRGHPPRSYSPRGYPRERSPGRGRYDDYGRNYGRRSPPLPRGRLEDGYGHGHGHGALLSRRPPYEHDPYERAPPGGYPDPYRNGDLYARPRSPPPRYGGGYGGYDDGAYARRYW